jgi:hypothetical protein
MSEKGYFPHFGGSDLLQRGRSCRFFLTPPAPMRLKTYRSGRTAKQTSTIKFLQHGEQLALATVRHQMH